MLLPLAGVTRRYPWGSRSALSALLGSEPNGEPEAEYWMGAHPLAPSSIVGEAATLDALVAADPVGMLGEAIAGRFGGLPFLFKLLAADQPLSIQVHPSAAAAAAGYQRENQSGIAGDAPSRVYRDPFHKPELVCAVSRFAALYGFRPLSTVREELAAATTPCLHSFADLISADGEDDEVLARTLEALLRQSPTEAAALNDELMALPRSELYEGLRRHYPDDPGVAVAVLMNHIVLEPGEALFLSAGTMHAYLGGVAVEVMANSDNVIRGGLTAKHLDIGELLANVDTRPVVPEPERPRASVHCFDPPVDEFTLTRAALSAGESFTVPGPAIVVVVDGVARLEAAGHEGLAIALGEPVFVPASAGATVVSADEPALIFAAGCDARR